jgi:hypothetical protein
MSEPDESADPLPDWRADLAAALETIGRWHMPFGKYGPANYPPHGMPLHDLPAEYVLWFRRSGFPKGRLGQLLALIADIHMAGAEEVFEPLRRARGGRRPVRAERRREWDFRQDELPLRERPGGVRRPRE